MNETLLSLSLVSRSWISSAVGALFFDPTRSISNLDGAWLFLQKLLQRPGLVQYVQALECLPSVCDLFSPLGALERTRTEGLQAETWTLSVLRHCRGVRSITLDTEMPVSEGNSWREPLRLLDNLRHLEISGVDVEAEGEDEGVIRLLRTIGDGALSCLVLEDLCLSGDGPRQPEQGEIKVNKVKLINVCIHSPPPAVPLPFFSTHLQHLQIRPRDLIHGATADFLLLPSLVSLGFRPIGKVQAPPNRLTPQYHADVQQWPFPFLSLPSLPNLTSLTLRNVYLHLDHLSNISTNAPDLEELALRGSTWKPEEWLPDANPEDAVTAAILRLPSLEYLHLGWVPVVNDAEISVIKSTCKGAGIRLRYKRSLESRNSLGVDEE